MLDLFARAELQTAPEAALSLEDLAAARECVWIHLTEAQAECLLAGVVPSIVRAQLWDLLHSELAYQANADKPVVTSKSRVGQTKARTR